MIVAGALDPLFRAADLEERATAVRRDDRTVEFCRDGAEGHARRW
jgi:hypothetical protein